MVAMPDGSVAGDGDAEAAFLPVLSLMAAGRACGSLRADGVADVDAAAGELGDHRLKPPPLELGGGVRPLGRKFFSFRHQYWNPRFQSSPSVPLDW